MTMDDAYTILMDAVDRGQVEYIPPYHPPMGAGFFMHQGNRIPANSTLITDMACAVRDEIERNAGMDRMNQFLHGFAFTER